MLNIFLGHANTVLKELLKKIPINLVLVEDKPSNRRVIKTCQKQKIKFIKVRNFNEILKAFKKIGRIRLCFVASFGIILKKGFIKKCQKIINFHFGDINVCRGRHPLPAAILNKHKTMGITVHLIESEKIDAGPVLAKVLLPIDYTKSYKKNEKKILRMSELITRFLINDYLKNKKFIYCQQLVRKSAYFRPLKKEIIEQIIKSNTLKDFLNEKNCH